MDNKIKHLEMIEKIIERMARNSFSLKGWTVALVVAISALATNGSEKGFILLGFIPIVIFWVLDSFYLQKEREYKILYKNVANRKEEHIDFNLDTKNIVYSKMEEKRVYFGKCLFSISEIFFYIPIIASILITIYFTKII